jgi:hypothetical protein
MAAITKAWPDSNMLDAAMGIISNVGQGNWDGQNQEWQDAARQWLDAYARLGTPGDQLTADHD